jgi:hypothetical protein
VEVEQNRRPPLPRNVEWSEQRRKIEDKRGQKLIFAIA